MGTNSTGCTEWERDFDPITEQPYKEANMNDDNMETCNTGARRDDKQNVAYTLKRANLIRQTEWDPDNKISLSYRGNEMAGECGEACNVIKKLDCELLGIRGSRATVLQLMEELADVVICADLIASSVGGDLEQAVKDKFNATSEKYGLKTRYR